jgi:hypothetical protein
MDRFLEALAPASPEGARSTEVREVDWCPPSNPPGAAIATTTCCVAIARPGSTPSSGSTTASSAPRFRLPRVGPWVRGRRHSRRGAAVAGLAVGRRPSRDVQPRTDLSPARQPPSASGAPTRRGPPNPSGDRASLLRAHTALRAPSLSHTMASHRARPAALSVGC